MSLPTSRITLLPHALAAVVRSSGCVSLVSGGRQNGYALVVTRDQKEMLNKGETMTTEVKEKRRRGLSAYEQETIINFNKEESIAYVFTYEKTWQRHLERRLGLKPTMNNGHGGKEYQLPKSSIPMPRAKRRYSEQTKKKMAARLARVRGKQHSLL